MRHNDYMSALAAHTAPWCNDHRPGGIITLGGGEGRPRRPLIVTPSGSQAIVRPRLIVGPDGTGISNDDEHPEPGSELEIESSEPSFAERQAQRQARREAELAELNALFGGGCSGF